MSQSSVTRHYNIRKRNVGHVEIPKPPQNIVAEDVKVKIELEKEVLNVKTIRLPKSVKDNTKDASKKKTPAPVKKGKKQTTTNDKKSNGKQSTIKTFFTSESEKPKNEKSKNAKTKNCISCVRQERISSPFKNTDDFPSHSLQSPKRNHSSPSDEGTPSKKKHLEESVSSVTEAQVIDKRKVTSRRKLKMDSVSSKSNPVILSPELKLVTPSPQQSLKTPDKFNALIDQSRLKLIHNPKHDELKKALQVFFEKTTKLKKLQSNPYMINCIASSKSHQKKKPIPTVTPREKFNHLILSDLLCLPFKYQVLSEMFKSMDFIVAMLHNRKKNIMFDSVMEGVKANMKRDFSEKHLGQIVTVFPSAYNLSREKTSYICKKNSSPEYQLIITPNFNADKGSNKKAAFQHMEQSCLTSRINEFNRNLLELVKKHHQDFLTRKHFVTVSEDILRWHPKFEVDSVPDIPVAKLPELPEIKTYTAKDVVLNKLKGSFRNKVEKTLPSVAEDNEKFDVTLKLKKLNTSKPETPKELKSIPVDLIERIRGKESKKLLETIAQTPSETKQLEMLNLGKIVNILFHFFISERKKTLPVDTVVDNIKHSLDSLSTPGEVIEYLKLIQEKFPNWLGYVQIQKGVYITVDKSINIYEMLDNAGLH